MISLKSIVRRALMPTVVPAMAVALAITVLGAGPASALTITPPTHAGNVIHTDSSANPIVNGPGVGYTFNGIGSGLTVTFRVWAVNYVLNYPVSFYFTITGPSGVFYLDVPGLPQCATGADQVGPLHLKAGTYHALETSSIGWTSAQNISVHA